MSELYKSVARHLQIQRDSATAIKLWDKLWVAYEKNGAEGVNEFVKQMVEFPDEGEEEQA